MISVYSQPAWNAAFNSLSFFCLLAALVAIRRGRERAHRNFILAAFFFSTLFLAGYLRFHFEVGRVVYPATGWEKRFYLLLLGTHSILAAVVPPAAIYAAVLGLRGRRERHRRLARPLMGIWLYVSLTGVLLFWILRPFYPAG